MSPFREPERATYNRTEVEIARIREREETVRRVRIAREETKRSPAYLGVWAFIAFIALMACVAYVNTKSPSLCHDEVLRVAGGSRCPHPEQIGKIGSDGTLFCACPRPQAAPASTERP
jgi:hypothetical protein